MKVRQVWPRRRAPRMTDRDAKPKPVHTVSWENVRVSSRTHKPIRSKAARELNLFLWRYGRRVLYVRDGDGRLLCPNEVDWTWFSGPTCWKGGPLDFPRDVVTVGGSCTNCNCAGPELLRHEVVVHVHLHVHNSKKTRRAP